MFSCGLIVDDEDVCNDEEWEWWDRGSTFHKSDGKKFA